MTGEIRTIQTFAQDERCQEVVGENHGTLVRCHREAIVLLQHVGRTEGPYFMCLSCGDHNIRHRNAEAVQVKRGARFPAEWGVRVPGLLYDKESVKTEALTWPARARALTVQDDTSYKLAAETLQGIKALRLTIAETFDPHIKRAHEAHRALCKEKSDAEAPLLEAETLIKASLADYNTVQERRRQEEQRRLEEQARQDEERRRVEAAAALEREAVATDSQALLEEAIATLETPQPAAPVFVPRATPKVSGIAHRDSWSAKVTSAISLIRFVAAHPEHVNLLTPNQTALNALARSMKQHLKIDGVQAVNTPTVSASGR